MPKAKKTKTSERRKKSVSRKPNRRKNVEGNWRGIEDAFFNRVRKGFARIFSPKY